jgi:hypothetical protein
MVPLKTKINPWDLPGYKRTQVPVTNRTGGYAEGRKYLPKYVPGTNQGLAQGFFGLL